LTTVFTDRVEAGRVLASELLGYAEEDVVVLAIPRGGIIVAYEVAHVLGALLDIIVPRKIRAPQNPELAIGAVTENGTILLDRDLVDHLEVPERYIEEESEKQRSEIRRRLRLYRGDVPYPELEGKTVILVDDGIATGSTVKAALASIRNTGAKTIVVAVPVAPPSTVKELESLADRIVCLSTPEPFYAIGQFYKDFTQTKDEEVTRLMRLRREELVEK
jgi:predicted phosphoribosyltransferase